MLYTTLNNRRKTRNRISAAHWCWCFRFLNWPWAAVQRAGRRTCSVLYVSEDGTCNSTTIVSEKGRSNSFLRNPHCETYLIEFNSFYAGEPRPFCPSSTAHGTSRILSRFVKNIKTHDQKYNMPNMAVLEEYDNSRSWTTKIYPESQSKSEQVISRSLEFCQDIAVASAMVQSSWFAHLGQVSRFSESSFKVLNCVISQSMPITCGSFG